MTAKTRHEKWLEEDDALGKLVKAAMERAAVLADALEEHGFITDKPYDFMWGNSRAVGMLVMRKVTSKGRRQPIGVWAARLRLDLDGTINVEAEDGRVVSNAIVRAGLGEFLR